MKVISEKAEALQPALNGNWVTHLPSVMELPTGQKSLGNTPGTCFF